MRTKVIVAAVVTVVVMLGVSVAQAGSFYQRSSPGPAVEWRPPWRPFNFSSPEAFARWAGCPGVTVVLDWRYSDFGGGFNISARTITLYGGLLKYFRSHVWDYILAHEVYHCVVNTPGQSQAEEWAADAFAVRVGLMLGHPNAHKEYAALLIWWARSVGLPLDYPTSHGSIRQRIDAAGRHGIPIVAPQGP